MKMPILDFPHNVDEAVDQRYADISLNNAILLSSINENLLSIFISSWGITSGIIKRKLLEEMKQVQASLLKAKT